MPAKTKKSDSELRQSIFDKIGYEIEYQDLECDEETGDEIEDSEEGYYWTDDNNERGCYDVYDRKEDCIYDCLANIDLETECGDVKLTKAEKAYLKEEFDVEL